MLSTDVWEYSEPEQGEFDSLIGLLDGRFRNARQPALIYVCSLRNHPSFVKVGITKASADGLRFVDPEMGDILYDSSRDEEFNSKLGRDLPRAEAWLREQYIFRRFSNKREYIPALKDRKWSGWTETFKIPNTANARYVRRNAANQSFRESIAGEISRRLSITNKYVERIVDHPRGDFLSEVRSLLLWSAGQTPEIWKQLASEICTNTREKNALAERFSQFCAAYSYSNQISWPESFEEFYQDDHVDYVPSREEEELATAETILREMERSRWDIWN